MSAHPPPIPPEQRSDKTSGKAGDANPVRRKETVKERDRNLAEQDRQGAVQQNTTNKGFQQDR